MIPSLYSTCIGHFLVLVVVTTGLRDRHGETICHVTEPWYCDIAATSEAVDSSELLRFEYKNKHGVPDIIGNVLVHEEVDAGDNQNSCDTCNDVPSDTIFTVKQLTHTSRPISTESHQCYELTLQGHCRSSPQLCLNTAHALWYGGAELHNQRWPLNQVKMADQPYITNDFVSFTTSYGNVIERFWINSRGVGVFINETVPLNVALKDDQICFTAKYNKHFKNLHGSWPVLNVTICDTDNVKDAFKLMSELFLDRVEGVPDERMFTSPIWSTWAKYKTAISEETVLSYTDEIVEHGFSNSQLEIDDMYSSYYGDFDFSVDKFENASRMISKLKSMGFRVTVWITPFANLDSNAFQIGMKNSYWLESSEGVPALVKWWQGIGATLDVTNPDAVDWFIERLNRMQQVYGVDSFKFDAGETSYVPSQCNPRVPWADTSTYATKYVEAVSRLGSMIEVRCGYRSQRHPVFVRMADKESRWGHENGLKTLIPTVLTLGLMGYPYILPDMIGGNGYNYDTDSGNPFTTTILPERELYIRWLEVTSYLPAMQFSFVPWQYDDKVVEIAKRYVKIHEDVVTPIVLDAAKEAQSHGTPIVRPLWWKDPDDLHALETDSEFVVGDTLLVAPILEKGARKRDIYLPPGLWTDGLRRETLKGGKWLMDYKIKLDEIATFWLILSDKSEL